MARVNFRLHEKTRFRTLSKRARHSLFDENYHNSIPNFHAPPAKENGRSKFSLAPGPSNLTNLTDLRLSSSSPPACTPPNASPLQEVTKVLRDWTRRPNGSEDAALSGEFHVLCWLQTSFRPCRRSSQHFPVTRRLLTALRGACHSEELAGLPSSSQHFRRARSLPKPLSRSRSGG